MTDRAFAGSTQTEFEYDRIRRQAVYERSQAIGAFMRSMIHWRSGRATPARN